MIDGLEMIARAIVKARYEDDNERLNLGITWDVLGARAQDNYRKQAQAAVDAMMLAAFPATLKDRFVDKAQIS